MSKRWMPLCFVVLGCATPAQKNGAAAGQVEAPVAVAVQPAEVALGPGVTAPPEPVQEPAAVVAPVQTPDPRAETKSSPGGHGRAPRTHAEKTGVAPPPKPAEPAPKPQPAAAPAPAAYAGPDPCKLATKGDSAVARACQQGGVKEAKKLMKAMVRKAKDAGVKFDCDGCHDGDTFDKLTGHAKEDFAKLADLYAR